MKIGEYVLATVVGFRSSALRCKVERVDERSGNIWVRTADLLDSGTPLVLDLDKVQPEPQASTGLRHRDGLVVIA